MLTGVGDEGLGEWEEQGDIAYHLRRRLSPEEQQRIGLVCDVRGTWEGHKRTARMQKYLPLSMQGQEV